MLEGSPTRLLVFVLSFSSFFFLAFVLVLSSSLGSLSVFLSLLFSLSLRPLFGVPKHLKMRPGRSRNDSQTASGGVWGVSWDALGPQEGDLQTALWPFEPFGLPFWSPQGCPGEAFGTLLGDFWTSRRAFL